jgi:chemotaxis protein methyltransferase CheR
MSTSTDGVKYLRDFVRRRSAIVIESGKEYLIESRLGPLARDEGLASVDALVRKIRGDERGALARRVIEAMTTNETSFFRDAHPFDALGSHMLPALVRARLASRTLRIWCAASSTGQEPYSIAMTLSEHVPDLASWNVQILATDINAEVLSRARAGVYKPLEVGRGLGAARLAKHFEPVGEGWRVKPELRRLVTFQELNLLETWPLFSALDVVFIRNVLIYFDVPTKRAILARIRQHLRPDGFLVLGGAETTMNIDDEYQPVRVGQSVYYQPAVPAKVAAGGR